MKVDFRCVAATNKPLEQLIEEGRFRPDLYYRLNVFRIELPPLRERRDDIPMLVDHFVSKFSREMNKKILRVNPRAMDLLQQYHWPGNIRELENAVERAMVVSQEPELRERDFTIQPHATTAAPLADARSLEDIEKTHILRVLDECGGNQTRAAEILEIDRVTLHHKLKKYGWSKQALTAPENSMKVLQLLPIGGPHEPMLDWLRSELSEAFQIRCEILSPPLRPEFAFHRRTRPVPFQRTDWPDAAVCELEDLEVARRNPGRSVHPNSYVRLRRSADGRKVRGGFLARLRAGVLRTAPGYESAVAQAVNRIHP